VCVVCVLFAYIYTVWRKSIGPPQLTIHRTMAGDFLAPVFWYIILICYPHDTHTIAPTPAPLLLYDPEHYVLAENKVSQWDIVVWYL
jgi:hypothetical protein